METIAQKLSDRVGNNGHTQKTPKGTDFARLCRRLAVAIECVDECTSYRFDDESAIVFCDDGWDILHPGCKCGHCWSGGQLICPQQYIAADYGGGWDIEANSLDEAIAEAENATLAAYSCDFGEKSFQVHVQVRHAHDRDQAGSVTVCIDPEEPDCEDGEDHDWEEVSTQGSGGGVVVVYRCSRCGMHERINTWDSCHDCGQVYESVRYYREE